MNYDQLPSGLRRLGGEIREVRKARGLTLQDMSDAVSCSVAYLSRIERGSARVSSELLTEISAALAVDTECIFPLQEGVGPLERQHVVRAGNRRSLSGMSTRSKDELGFERESCDPIQKLTDFWFLNRNHWNADINLQILGHLKKRNARPPPKDIFCF